MIISYYPFLLLLAWTGASADCPCENNGTCVENTTACLCPPEFIGQICNYPATLLTPKPQNFSISENYSYVYLLPEDLSFYSVELKFCLEKSVPNYFNEFYLTLEGLENEFTPGKIEDKKMYPLIFGEDSCISQAFRYIWYKTKTNGEIQKIIIGIRIQPNKSLMGQAGSDANPIEILSMECTIEELFSLKTLLTIVFIFFGFVGFMMFSSCVYVFIKKYQRHRQKKKEKMKNINLIKKLMPSKKYSTLNEQSDGEQICSICLSIFSQEDVVRKTPCEHVFHQDCLDSWCKSHMTCPICRLDLENNEENQANSPAINITAMVREPML